MPDMSLLEPGEYEDGECGDEEFPGQVLHRFNRGADQDTKKEFAQRLIAAFEELEIGHGKPFVVMAAAPWHSLHEERDSLASRLEEAEWYEDNYESIREWMADLERGVMTLEEVQERIRRMDLQT